MKNYIIATVFALSLTTPIVKAQTAPTVSDQVFLDNGKLAIPSLKFFRDYFAKPRALSFKEVEVALEQNESDPKGALQVTKYMNGVLPILSKVAGKTFEEADDWKKENPKIAKGIALYVESPVKDGMPIWQIINNKLRDGRKFDTAETSALKNILYSLDQLPSIAGIVFRGAGMKPEYFAMYKKGAIVVEPTFVSTSISINVAKGYADMSGSLDYNSRPTAGKIPTIFILKIKRGAPVGSVVPDYILEFEALLRPRTSFKVHDVMMSKTQAYVFLEEI